MWKLKDPEFKKKINAFFSDEEIADACNKDMGKSNGVVILSDYDYEEGNPEKRGIGIFIKTLRESTNTPNAAGTLFRRLYLRRMVFTLSLSRV